MIVDKKPVELVLSEVPEEDREKAKRMGIDILREWRGIKALCESSINTIALKRKPKSPEAWTKYLKNTSYPEICQIILDNGDVWVPILNLIEPKEG